MSVGSRSLGSTPGAPPEGLGQHHSTLGRDESPRQQWAQAALLGLLIALFSAPAFAFPLASAGFDFVGLYGIGLPLLAVSYGMVVKVLRNNRAVRLHEHGLVLVDRSETRPVLFSSLRSARYSTGGERLELELSTGGQAALRLPPALGATVVRRLATILNDSEAPTVQAP